MRVEQYTVGSYLHIIKRGARGGLIVRDEADHYRFLRTLYLLNDKSFNPDWKSSNLVGLFSRPKHWEERRPIVDILAYTLIPNHFHLILREIEDGGVSLFMKRLGQSMTNHANEKYEEKGSLFQGAYRSRTIESDEYFRYVAAYVMVKNTFELYPDGGLDEGVNNFEKVWDWAAKYKFSSLGDYTEYRDSSPILTPGLLGEIFSSSADFKVFAKDMILGRTPQLVSPKDLE